MIQIAPEKLLRFARVMVGAPPVAQTMTDHARCMAAALIDTAMRLDVGGVTDPVMQQAIVRTRDEAISNAQAAAGRLSHAIALLHEQYQAQQAAQAEIEALTPKAANLPPTPEGDGNGQTGEVGKA